MRVLLVGDPAARPCPLSGALAPAKMIIDRALDFEDARALLRQYDHDLIVVDGTLPESAALAAIRRLRAAGIDIPLIWFCGRATAARRAEALDLGADDCLGLALEPVEVLARARAARRRGGGHAAGTIEIGDLSIDLAARQVDYAGRRLRITGKEFRILELLALRKGATVGRGAIMNYLYGGLEEPGDKVIDIHICRIRQKLAKAAADRGLLRTIRGQGFLLGEPASRRERMAA